MNRRELSTALTDAGLPPDSFQIAGVHETGHADAAWWTSSDEVGERVARVARTWVL